MSVKLTKDGKPCKLCIKKGGPCHLHAGKTRKPAGKKTAVKKAVPVKKATKRPVKKAAVKAPKRKVATKNVGKISPGIDRFATLPRDVLRLILLEMDRAELTKIRKLSKRAREMSNTNLFKSQYMSKHDPAFFIGPVTIRRQHLRYADKNYAEKYILSDLDGRSVLVAGFSMDAEGDNDGPNEKHVFIIHWIGYSNRPVPKPPVAAKSKTSVVPFSKLKEGYKHINFRTNSQVHQTIISETINAIADEFGPQSTEVILADH